MIKDMVQKQRKNLRQKVRTQAMFNADENLYKYGRNKNELSTEEYLELVAMEEDTIWEDYTNKTVSVAALLFLGTWF
mgnify:FL=1|tara:strand:+ start:145 stop:375 length:231 start_codon:yes stop_codon:yes gene_type:complete